MAFTLFPRVVQFYDLLVQQNHKMVEAVSVLDEVFADPRDVSAKCKRIVQIEAEGDTTAREITKLLSRTFITPIDKEDIHALSLDQEEVQDLVKVIATRMMLYGFEQVRESARELARTLKRMGEVVGMMLTLVIERKGVHGLSMEIRELKDGAEALLLSGLGEIYDTRGGEQDGLLDVIKWTQIYDRIGQAVHRTAALAATLEGISLKYA